MKYSITARAYGTVANQPTFDGGGFPIRMVEELAGKSEAWETLYDEVELQAEEASAFGITLVNEVLESNVATLAVNPERHTGGRVLLAVARKKTSLKQHLTLTVRKGLSLKGTGLGSSGATAAATLKAFEALLSKMGQADSLSDAHKIEVLKEADFGVPDNSIPSYYGGLVVMEGSTFRRLTLPPQGWGSLVLITPKNLGIKTEDTRRVLRGKMAPPEEAMLKERMIAAFEKGDMEDYARAMEQAHAWFVGPRKLLYPRGGHVYDQLVQAAVAAGAAGITISGSGPTLLALMPPQRSSWSLAQALCETFRRNGFESMARLVDIESEGAQIIQ
jgi:homoserine kinase